ncbi:GAF domain-containing protein [Fulvivirga ulvae]|uniref:cache domain-containing protein n=1 Tax=Fulvivirga ulvae TaxID=2904245 RepID=UPI001F47930B|nr:cache domain-containing protein [Fulvivirga ulvae]UII34876.1 GAF domain-containing protein [Fulvivirga ulvae]
MKLRGLKYKLLLQIMPVVTVIFLACIGYIIFSLRQQAIEDNEKLAFSYVEEVANEVKARMNEDIGLSRAIANAAAVYKDSLGIVRENFIKGMLSGVVEGEDSYHSAWLSIELSHFEPTWNLPYGRKRYTFYHQGPPAIDSANLKGDLRGSSYLRLKQEKREEVNDPYYYTKYSDAGDERNDVLGTSICAPVLINGEFGGVGGVDISLEHFQYVSDFKPFDQSQIFLISNNGTFVSHPNQELIGKKLDEMISPEIVDRHELDAKISHGQSFMVDTEIAKDGELYLLAFAPIELGNSYYPWTIGIIVPRDVILKDVNNSLLRSLLIAIFGIAIIAFVLWKISDNITKPLNKVNALIKEIAQGDIDLSKKVPNPTDDEVGEISLSANALIDDLNNKVEFAKSIGSGNLDMEHETAGEQDILGKSLIAMRESLKESKIDDERRSWVNRGLAKFTEILRLNEGEMEEFYIKVVSEMVKYIGVNQAGLFVINNDEEDNTYLELVAAYAYERRKFIEKRVDLDEGLVGQCYKEKQRISLTELPADYIHITSGLGIAPPTHVFLVPIRLEEDVLGVMEFASFEVVPEYKIEFVEKLAESLASTISTLKTNQRTRILLEQSQQQSEELRAQEEEMRQNMEEMEATQEEMKRTQKLVEQNQMLMEVILNQAGDSVLVFDKHYSIVLINDVLKARYKGTQFEMGVGDNLLEKLGSHKDMWQKHYEKVLGGQQLQFTIKSQLKDSENFRFYFMSPIRDTHGEVRYVSVITRDANIDQYSNVLTQEQFESL